MQKVFITMCAICFGILFAGCEQAASPPLSQSEASTMMSEAMFSIAYEMNMANMSTSRSFPRGIYEINYTNDTIPPSVTITGWLTVPDEDPYYPVTLDMSCDFTNYVPASGPGNVTSIDGVFSSAMVMISEMSMSYDINGSLTIVYKGTSYICVWAIHYAFPSAEMTGTFTVNGYDYSY